ncbi:MAG: helix-turn-helix domain-containing protein [Defluviitaleaceae bacterium]|nr:helix-turn-helix domain-containing protein [Defluviitaleaceae bacterium]
MNEQHSIYASIGYKLAEHRKHNELSQGQFADILQIPRRTYGNYELGIRKIPLDILLKIADYYKLPVSHFVSGNVSEAV